VNSITNEVRRSLPSIHCTLRCLMTAFVGACVLPACAGSPTNATPPDTGGPKISCPSAPPPVQSLDNVSAFVGYGMPTVAGGFMPLTGPTCAPSTGTLFKVGSTPVTCTVIDSKARTDSCTFNVTVLAPATLSLTRFLAFGDSITAGEIVSEGFSIAGGVRVRPLVVDPYLNYPVFLTEKLAIQYRSQQPRPAVKNAGVPGETSSAGVGRLAREIALADQPQVLLLLEGANDLGTDPSAILPAALNIATMIRTAKASGLRVFVGTLPPQNPAAPTGSGPSCVARNGGAGLVVRYNDALKVVAAQESVTLVDVYQAFGGDVTTLIDCDGLHPTSAGYDVIAQAFFTAIKQNLEVPATVTPTRLARPVVVPPRPSGAQRHIPEPR
jgi:acyl-CoA thioesterase-1